MARACDGRDRCNSSCAHLPTCHVSGMRGPFTGLRAVIRTALAPCLSVGRGPCRAGGHVTET